MSLFNFSSQQPIICKHQFNSVYDKYGPGVYGLLLQLTNKDAAVADALLQAVFVELYSDKNFDNETERISFSKMLQLTITVSARNGYYTTSLFNNFCIAADKVTVKETKHFTAPADDVVSVFE